MKIYRRLFQSFMTVVLLGGWLISLTPAQDPGLPISNTAAPNENIFGAQKPGSVLVFNYFTSNSINPNTENTAISLTNTHFSQSAFVRLFFVDGSSGVATHQAICLVANQTLTFRVADVVPDTTGYLVAVAISSVGCPVNFNYLLGSAAIKRATGHFVTLPAQSLAAIAATPVTCDGTSTTATLLFDGQNYNRLPRALAVNRVRSPANGNSTFLVVNRISGNLTNSASAIGPLSGLLIDDTTAPFSFTASGGVQFRSILSNTFPATTPLFSQVIPSGRKGWMQLWADNDVGLLGAQINFNATASTSATAFNGGSNLHTLTLSTTSSLIIPVIAPTC